MVTLDPREPGQRIDDGVFRDTGLRLAWTSPAGFDFADYDLTWPERTLVALEAGATAVEYCLIAASIFLAIVTAVTQVGIDLQAPFNTANAGLN